MSETKYHPCNVCGKDAIACLSPDMDIKGLCFCEEHREDVYIVYVMIIQGTPEMAEKAMKNWKFK